MWVNQRDGTFRNMALPWGAALGAGGNAKADMGVGAGDFDNDGDEDLFITELTGQGSTLYVNDGTGLFRERSAALGIRAPSLPFTGFGAGWIDIDNDGWLDIVAVNGTVVLNFETRGENPFPLDPAQPGVPQPGRRALRGRDGAPPATCSSCRKSAAERRSATSTTTAIRTWWWPTPPGRSGC